MREDGVECQGLPGDQAIFGEGVNSSGSSRDGLGGEGV